MKLIGSKTEQEIREQLIRSNQSFFKSEEDKRLIEVVKYEYPEMKTAYIIYWIPEQDEDIYYILINDRLISIIDLNRNNYEVKPVVKTLTVKQYLQGLSKQKQITLAVALDLAQQDLKA